MPEKQLSPLNIPIAIIIAGAIIAAAIIWIKNPTPIAPKVADDQAVTINLAAVSSTDHIFGNPNAPLKIVEYSDASCPFCKMFNPTMESVISKFGPSGKVAWVYRHFPLDKPDADGNIRHKNAGHEAQAMECVGDIGGNEKFWAFEKSLYETTPSVTGQTPDGLDQAQLPIIAKGVGIDTTAFNKCLSSGKFKDTVEKQYLTGVKAGVSGTPISFFVLDKPAASSVSDFITNALITYKIPQQLLYMSDDKKIIALSGAMPEELVMGIITAIQGQ